MKAREFDAAFDAGEDVSAGLDWSAAHRPNLDVRRVNVDFPAWMIEGLDARAAQLGVTRQAVVKTWIAERLETFGRGMPAGREALFADRQALDLVRAYYALSEADRARLSELARDLKGAA